MGWGRFGDTATTHPAYMAGAVVAGADTRTQLELYGFYHALMSMYAAHPGERVIVEIGTVYRAGGPNTDRLVEQATEAGYMTPTEVDGRQAWELLNDPAFVHVRTRPEIDRDRARKRDNGNPALTLAVQRRDGSQCRYCGVPVTWGDNVGARGGTYDHLDPGELGKQRRQATSADELVVSCRSCNSARGVAHRDGRLREWDAANPLRPVPPDPHYCEHVKSRLTENGLPGGMPRPAATDTARTPERPDSQSDTAGGSAPRPVAVDTARAPERPAATDTARTPERPDSQSDTAGGSAPRPVAVDTATESMGTEVDSPGRDGPGRAGSGRRGGRGRRGRRNAGHGRDSPKPEH